MNKFQKLNFQSIDDFLEYLPEDELKIVKVLRKIILECLPDGTEKLAYNVPYYYRHSRICYIWPASVAWGGIQAGVDIGFCRGILLADEIGYLNKTNRKEMATKNFYSVPEIDVDLLKAYIFEAIELDERAFKMKKQRR